MLGGGEREGDRFLEAHLGACCVRLAPVPRAEARGCEEVLVELRVYVGIADRADRGRCTEQPCGALRIAATSCDCRQAAQALGGEVLHDVLSAQPKLLVERVLRPVQIIGEECLQTDVAAREGQEDRISELMGERDRLSQERPCGPRGGPP